MEVSTSRGNITFLVNFLMAQFSAQQCMNKSTTVKVTHRVTDVEQSEKPDK